MIISAIVAKDKNNLIGIGLEMPWHLPKDFKYFKETTLGHPIIFGRVSFESIGSKPLPNRTNIVVSKNPKLKYNYENVHTVTTVEDAIALSKTFDSDETFICGGGQIYQYVIKNKLIDKLYITEVDTKIDVNDSDQYKCVYFPQIGNDGWNLEKISKHGTDEKNKYSMKFLIYNRNY